MTIKSLTAATLAIALLPSMGLAQDGPRGPMPQFDFASADADANGGISYPEFTAYLQAQMQERRAAQIAERADRLLAAGDANGDGALTRDELIAGAEAMGDERRARMQEHREEMRGEDRGMRGDRDGYGMRGHDRDGSGMRGHGRDGGQGDHAMRGGHGAERGGHGMRGMDPERMANRMFDRIDRDNDGQISPDEAQVAQERMQERMERRMERRNNG